MTEAVFSNRKTEGVISGTRDCKGNILSTLLLTGMESVGVGGGKGG